MADQFYAIIHMDETRAVEPLERTTGWEQGEVPEHTRSPCRHHSAGRAGHRRHAAIGPSTLVIRHS